LNYIDQHLHEQIFVSDLAALTGFNKNYLSMLFKKHIGLSIRDYVKNKRLEAAKAMLHGECDQEQIAYNLGFCSQTYFISCFKEAYGITPHKYAAMCRGATSARPC